MIMYRRFVTEAIDVFVFDEGQTKVDGEFLIEGETSANLALQ